MPRLDLGRKRVEYRSCDPSDSGKPCYYLHEAETADEGDTAPNTVLKLDLGLVFLGNVP